MKQNGIKQIAEKAGVNHSTVSRVLNNRPGISEDTRKRILNIASDMQYRSTVHKRTRTIVVLMPLDLDGYDAYIALLMQALASTLREKQYRAIFIYRHDISLVNEIFIDGCISLCHFGHVANEGQIASEWARIKKTPLVCLNDFNSYSEKIPCVYSDEFACAQSYLAQLSSLGHREVTGLLYFGQTFSSRIRKQCFLQKAVELNIKSNVIEFPPLVDDDAIKEAIEKLPDTVTALINMSESYSPRVLAIVRKLRPQMQMVCWCFPFDLSRKRKTICVSQDNNKLAQIAVEVLEQRMNKQLSVNRPVPYKIL